MNVVFGLAKLGLQSLLLLYWPVYKDDYECRLWFGKVKTSLSLFLLHLAGVCTSGA